MEAIQQARVGDDVFGDDPTVRQLECRMAEMVGMQAGVFVSSGTQSNLIGLMTHLQRGEEFIIGDQYHVFKFEACGTAVLGSLAPHPLPTPTDGRLTIESIEAAIRPDDYHHPATRLLSLENTFNGIPIPLEHQNSLADFAHQKGLIVHLDGARFFNACTAMNVTPIALAEKLDSVSICLSKGLGAPVGSVLCGTKDYILRARRIRKMLGGGMRQAGILAACGLVALDEEIPRLKQDHKHAAILAEGLRRLNSVSVLEHSAETNMVFISLEQVDPAAFNDFMKTRNIIIGAASKKTRIVLHRDISRAGVDSVLGAFEEYFRENPDQAS